MWGCCYCSISWWGSYKSGVVVIGVGGLLLEWGCCYSTQYELLLRWGCCSYGGVVVIRVGLLLLEWGCCSSSGVVVIVTVFITSYY